MLSSSLFARENGDGDPPSNRGPRRYFAFVDEAESNMREIKLFIGEIYPVESYGVAGEDIVAGIAAAPLATVVELELLYDSVFT